jgi:signal transduction histidine kinase
MLLPARAAAIGGRTAIAATHGQREARLLDASLALTLDLELPAVLRHLVTLGAELTGAKWCAFGVFGADGVIVDLVSTGSREPALGQDPLPAPGPGVLCVQARVHGRPFGELCVAGRRDGAEFDEEDRRSLEILAAHAAVAIDNAGLRAEARGHGRQLEALREVAAGLLAGSPLEELLELIADHARRLARAEFGGVMIPGPNEGALVMEAVAGSPEGLRGLELPLDSSIAGRVIRTGRSEVIAHVAVDPRAFRPAARLGRHGPAMFLPLRAHSRPFGALMVARRLGEPGFGPRDVELVERFADLAALASEYASVHRELRRLAVLQDRERIARELHDGAIQALFAVGMGLQATAARSDAPEINHRLEGAVNELDRVISDLRSYIFELRPGVLAGRQVDQALRRLAEEIAAPAGVTAVVEVEEQVAVALSDRAADLIQLVREALANVCRHAGATTCRVSLYWRQTGAGLPTARAAVLEVDDDGHGFDLDTVRPGHGLDNLRARAGALGGTLQIESSSGEGTTVRVLIPL